MPTLRTLTLLSSLALAPTLFAESPTTAPSPPSIEDAAKNLTSDDFRQRQIAVKQIEALLTDQIAKRAQIQQALNDLQSELAHQIQTLALSSDPEAQAHTAGLLEMERGLSTWAIDAMSEPAETRKPLLAWGLSKEAAPLLARIYSRELKVRVQSIAQLAKLADDGSGGGDWTLSRLVNDKEPALRTAAIAALYDRKPTPKSVAALWYRAIVGPGVSAGSDVIESAPTPAADNPDSISIEFPGRDPIEFAPDDEDDFSDAVLATDVLVHMNSPLIGDRIKTYVAERKKSDDPLGGGGDNTWTLNVHHLIEAYNVRDAAPLLALEAVKSNFAMNTDEVNGHAFIWTDRTIAIGVLMKLDKQDPTALGILHVTNTSNNSDWLWGAANKKDEAQIVRKFQNWWKDHYKDFGLKANDPSITEPDGADQPEENNPPPPPPPAQQLRRPAHLAPGPAPVIVPVPPPATNPAAGGDTP